MKRAASPAPVRRAFPLSSLGRVRQDARALSRLPALAAAVRSGPGLSTGVGTPAAGGVAPDVATAEVVVLLLLGFGAALATAFLKLPLRVPGSSIVYTIFPTALGVALVPRRFSGTIVSGGALAGATVLLGAGLAAPGPGALTSMMLSGPFLDLALAGARTGWRLYLGFTLAGLAANLLAFTARAGTAMLGLAGGVNGPRRAGGLGRGAGLGHGMGAGGGLGPGPGTGAPAAAGHAAGLGAGPLGTASLWLHGALLTYAAAGLLAGLVSAAAWFRFRRRAP